MTDNPGLWSAAARHDACRAALGMALASQRNDIAGVLEIWNGSANPTVLLLALAELPSTAMAETAAQYGEGFDVEAALRQVAAGLAAMAPTGEESSE